VLLCVGYFQGRVSQTICPGWSWTVILLISASWVARIIGVSHGAQVPVNVSLLLTWWTSGWYPLLSCYEYIVLWRLALSFYKNVCFQLSRVYTGVKLLDCMVSCVWHFETFYYCVVYALYIFWLQLSHQWYNLWIFSPILWIVLSLSLDIICTQKISFFDKVLFIYFFFYCICFWLFVFLLNQNSLKYMILLRVL
jgi:hypothetical protein